VGNRKKLVGEKEAQASHETFQNAARILQLGKQKQLHVENPKRDESKPR